MKHPMKKGSFVPKNVPGVGWGVSWRGGVCHGGVVHHGGVGWVGCVMEGWGGVSWRGVHHGGGGWGEVCHGGVGWGGVSHGGGCVMEGWDGVGYVIHRATWLQRPTITICTLHHPSNYLELLGEQNSITTTHLSVSN